jgi:hypothetical protein
MGASLTMIDRHYSHLAKDGRRHAINLLDTFTAPPHRRPPAWTLWTSRGRQTDAASAIHPGKHALSRKKPQALCRTRTDDPFLTITLRAISAVLRMQVSPANHSFPVSGYRSL